MVMELQKQKERDEDRARPTWDAGGMNGRAGGLEPAAVLDGLVPAGTPLANQAKRHQMPSKPSTRTETWPTHEDTCASVHFLYVFRGVLCSVTVGLEPCMVTRSLPRASC
jgi:hypothetical protein